MKKIAGIITVAVLLLMVAPGTSAADVNGWYVGASLGRSTIDIGIIPEDPTNTAYKLFGGYRLGALALEGGYVDFGDTSDDYLGAPLDINVSGLDVFGVLNLPLGPIDLFGKVGLLFWDYEIDIASSSFTDSDTGSDSAVGIGAAIGVGSVRVRAEAEIFNVDPIDKVLLFSVGATLAF